MKPIKRRRSIYPKYTRGAKMAPRSKSAEVKRSDVHAGAAKEVLLALIEKLVEPLLPPSSNPPDEFEQEAVAKQMHTVVLLYNYYYRRQNREMKFVDFPSVCDLVVLLMPSISSFMTLKKEGQHMMLNVDEDRLSLTEKAMKNACEIAFALDASKDDPDTRSWPISDVAVLLVDSKKENCMLRFGEITKGVWSLIQRSICNTSYQQSAKGNVGEKRTRSTMGACSDDDELRQLAFGVVKNITGISDLVILESHVVYSLSEEKSAAQFYIIQAPRTFVAHDRTSLGFLIQCLQGPLAEKDEPNWKATSVVEHYHVLPYMGIISSWLLRKDSPSSYICHAKDTSNSSQLEPANQNSNVIHNKLKHSCDEEVANAMNAFLLTNGEDDANMNFLGSLNENVDEKLQKTDDIVLCGRRKSNRRNPSRGLSEKTMMDSDDALEKIKERRPIMSGVNLQMKALKSSLKESQVESNDANSSQQNSSVIIPLDEDKTVDTQNQLQVSVITEKIVPDPEVVRNALMLLNRKKQEHYSQMSIKEDMLELCERIMEKIRDGGDVSLARKCIDSILSGKKELMLNLENQIHLQLEKQSRFSGIYIPGKSKCKDLELMCFQNKWRLPRYCAEPSDGTKFKYSVFIIASKTLKLSATGGLANSPSEAKESAAAQMIVEACNSCK